MADVLTQHQNVRWTCVFLHQPLWTKQKPTNWDKLEALLQGRSYTVFAGHYHGYTKYQRKNQRYFILATTGGASSLTGPATGHFDHITWVTMTDHGPLPANLLLGGIYDENVLTEQTLPLAKQILDAGEKLQKGHLVTCTTMRTNQRFFTKASAKIKIANPLPIPLTFQAGFQQHPNLRPFPYSIKLTLPPNSDRLIDLSVRSKQPTPSQDIESLVMNAILTYALPHRPPVIFQCSRTIAIQEVK